MDKPTQDRRRSYRSVLLRTLDKARSHQEKAAGPSGAPDDADASDTMLEDISCDAYLVELSDKYRSK